MSNLLGSSIPLFKIKVQEKGRIKDIKEIIVRIDGLPTCLYGQIVDLGDGVKGIIMGYDEEEVWVLALGDPSKLKMGKEISGVSEPFKIPVCDELVGRMVTALGIPCDNAGDLDSTDECSVFQESPPMVHRGTIKDPMPTGTKIIDMVMPLSKGQRQLILGDRMTGKTVIAVDTILNQKGRDVLCVYCCIGKSMSAMEKVVSALHEGDALDYTLMVLATDNAPVGEQYIVPFSAASIADYFAKKGRDVLVVFDDLTKHAWAYRQLSLLLERPPGREAYPGDIFYVQTQLMERAGCFNEKHGNGSVTFLGVAETLQNDLTGYIPSNLSSMCDGQICLSSVIFAEGVRPAVDLAVSLSIVGGRTQPEAIKELSRELRADYARYNEIVKLSKMSSGLSEEAEMFVKKGEVLKNIFQQQEYNPVSLVECVLLLWAVHRGSLLDLTDNDRSKYSREIMSFAQNKNPALLKEIEENMVITSSVEKELDALLDAYFSTAAPEG
ncbi:MAG: F0F1 ATP synthase subunit alpha [Kiritimatiellae bacterium]|nr:F0F1 ATP synthase subunit alpha [Kiritimatiellia bacterium]